MMKKHVWMVRTVISAVILVAMLSVSAFAGATYDKGDLGKYNRHGKHMKLERNVASEVPTGTTVKAASAEAEAAHHKAHQGGFAREGRFVKRELKPAEHQQGAKASAPAYRMVNHIKHRHRMPL